MESISLFDLAPGTLQEDPAQLSPLVLAYLGDTVYDLYVRTRLVQATHAQSGKLHKQAVHYVCAAGQAQSLAHLTDRLTERELQVTRRGRNAKSPTMPKHATVADYRQATGFEALLGYLYLSGQGDRLKEILDEAFACRTQEDHHAQG